MSFLYDKETINELLKALTKEAQTTPGNVDDNKFVNQMAQNSKNKSEEQIQQTPKEAKRKNDTATIALAKKLVSSLDSEIKGRKEYPNISSTGDAQLDVKSLQNIDVFLDFLVTNQISFDGQRIAYNKDEGQSKTEQGYYPISSKTYRVDTDQDPSRKWNVVDFYANKNLLIAYIQFLQNRAYELKSSKKEGDQPKGQVLEVMLGKLIDSVNKTFTSTGLSKIKKSEPGKPKELPPDTIIDRWSLKVISTTHPSDHSDPKGMYALYAKDLANMQTLNAWLLNGQNTAAQIIVRDGQGFKTIVYKEGAELNPCTMMQAFYQRAKNKITTNPEEEKAKNFYITKIQEITPQFHGPDGKACQLTTVSDPNAQSNTNQPGATPGASGTDTGSGAGTGVGQGSDADFATLMGTLPFSMQDINLNRIENFLDIYNKIYAQAAKAQNVQNQNLNYAEFSRKKTRVNSIIQTYIRGKNAKELQDASEFILYRDPIQFSHYASIPSASNYLPLIDALHEVVQTTDSIVMIIKNQYPKAISQLEVQHNIARYNMEALSYLRSRYSDIVKRTGSL